MFILPTQNIVYRESIEIAEVAPADTEAPRVSFAYVYDATRLVIRFSEPMDGATINITGLVIKHNGNTAAVTISLRPNLFEAFVTFTFLTLNESTDVTAEYTPGTWQDIAGNALGATGVVTAINGIDTMPPGLLTLQTGMLIGAEYRNDGVLATFNEAVESDESSFDAGVTINDSVQGDLTIVTTPMQITSNDVFYIVEETITQASVLTWAYDADLGNITDTSSSQNKLATISAQPVTNYINDGPPAVSSVEIGNVANNIVQLILDENAFSPGSNYGGGFHALFNSADISLVTQGLRHVVNNNILLLTLDRSATPTDTVELFYSGGDIEDTNAINPLKMANFSNQAVVNNVSALTQGFNSRWFFMFDN